MLSKYAILSPNGLTWALGSAESLSIFFSGVLVPQGGQIGTQGLGLQACSRAFWPTPAPAGALEDWLFLLMGMMLLWDREIGLLGQ